MNKKCLFIGRSTVDSINLVGTYPSQNSKVFAEDNYLGAGGSALNPAVTFSYLAKEDSSKEDASKEDASKNCVLISSIGQGLYAEIVRRELSEYPIDLIDCSLDTDFHVPTATIVSSKDTLSRMIINAKQEDCSEVMQLPEDFFSQFDMILLDQHERHFMRAHRNALEHFQGTIVLDGGSWKEWSREYLSLATIPIVSEVFCKGGVSEMRVLAEEYQFSSWAITMGERGVLAYDYGKEVHIPAPKGNIVDTLGAGDVFHGAFCFYYSKGNGFVQSLEQASIIATTSCEYFGPRAWMNGGV